MCELDCIYNDRLMWLVDLIKIVNRLACTVIIHDQSINAIEITTFRDILIAEWFKMWCNVNQKESKLHVENPSTEGSI